MEVAVLCILAAVIVALLLINTWERREWSRERTMLLNRIQDPQLTTQMTVASIVRELSEPALQDLPELSLVGSIVYGEQDEEKKDES